MKLLGKAILIKPDELPERTKGGLLVPKTSKEEEPKTGTVLDIGNRCEYVRKGTRVIFPRANFSVIVIDGVDYYMGKENQLTYIGGDGEKLK